MREKTGKDEGGGRAEEMRGKGSGKAEEGGGGREREEGETRQAEEDSGTDLRTIAKSG